jgi:hypothetical protein
VSESIDKATGMNISSSMAEFSGTENTVVSNKWRDHQIWGSVGLCLIFLPGLIMIPPLLYRELWSYHVSYWCEAIKIVFKWRLFPITMLVKALWSVIKTVIDKDHSIVNTMIMVGGETFFESFPQLVLKGFTILYGYDSGYVQWFTIVASFVLLAKISISYDVLCMVKN